MKHTVIQAEVNQLEQSTTIPIWTSPSLMSFPSPSIKKNIYIVVNFNIS